MSSGLYQMMRWLLGLALGIYFRRIERFHAERVPLAGPVLLTSNHPNSVTDPFVIGASLPRKVSFVATVQLFRFAPVKWLLLNCGVIPINRLKDDPRGMRSVMDTFEAVYRVLEQGEAVAVFPEGITHDDPQLKEVKPGAARMALELEHRHQGKLGLQIIPVGLTFSAKERYRSEALTNFGESIRAAEYLENYETERKNCIRRLSQEIETRIQALILHIPNLEQARVVDAVKRLYLDRLKIANRVVSEAITPQAEELELTRRISAVVSHVFSTSPETAARFTQRFNQYERNLARLRISDAELASAQDRSTLIGQSLGRSILAILGLPVALYGWLFRLLPILVVRWAVRNFAKPTVHKAQISTAAIVAGCVAFSIFYSLYLLVCHWLWGWPPSLWFGLSLPISGLIAHYYLRNVRKLAAAVRAMLILLRAPTAAKKMIALRLELLKTIETAHQTIAPQQKVATP